MCLEVSLRGAKQKFLVPRDSKLSHVQRSIGQDSQKSWVGIPLRPPALKAHQAGAYFLVTVA